MHMLALSWKNLVSKPLDLLLSVLLFALGIGLISFLVKTSEELEDNFSKNLVGIDLVIGAKGSPLQLILCSMFHVDAPTGNIALAEARPFLNPGHPLIEKAIPLSLGDNFQGFRIVGTTHDLVDLYNAKVAEGRLWAEPFGATIGAEVARRMDLRIGSTFKSSHGLISDETMAHDHDFKVSGIFAPSGSVIDQLILCSQETIWHVHEHEAQEEAETPGQEITSLLVKFRGQNFQTLNLARNINENTNLLAASPAIEMNRLYANIGVGEEALRALAWLIVLVSGLSIFIALFNSLKNRKYELALIRVMGGTRSILFLLIITEGLLIAGMGFVAGILLSNFGMTLFADAIRKAYRYSFSAWEFSSKEAWLLVASLLIGFIAAVIPAVQASRTEISKTLAEG